MINLAVLMSDFASCAEGIFHQVSSCPHVMRVSVGLDKRYISECCFLERELKLSSIFFNPLLQEESTTCPDQPHHFPFHNHHHALDTLAMQQHSLW
jgi:hypothetical protein